MALAFRNLDVTPDEPVEVWGFEGLLAAVDRGSLTDWRRIVSSVRDDPWGDVARTLTEVLDSAEDVGVAMTLRHVRERARKDADQRDREEVAVVLRDAVEASGLTQREFASRIGTSASRLSTYLSGQTTPSAAMFLRAIRTAAQISQTIDSRSTAR